MQKLYAVTWAKINNINKNENWEQRIKGEEREVEGDFKKQQSLVCTCIHPSRRLKTACTTHRYMERKVKWKKKNVKNIIYIELLLSITWIFLSTCLCHQYFHICLGEKMLKFPWHRHETEAQKSYCPLCWPVDRVGNQQVWNVNWNMSLSKAFTVQHFSNISNLILLLYYIIILLYRLQELCFGNSHFICSLSLIISISPIDFCSIKPSISCHATNEESYFMLHILTT